MKKNNFLFLVLLVTVGFFACHHHKDSDPQPVSDLINTWTVGKVTLDGTDVTDYFTNMTITFNSSGSYSVVSTLAQVWPSTGKYTYKESDKQIQRDDNVVIQVLELSKTRLSLQFQYASKSGRLNEISGIYKFEFAVK